uniref:ADAM metallopeptidase domain 11 n=1 Tax=Oryctolagus cuniculus TaxID=9986 RepID=A0A5F9CGC9_RABIT
TAVRSGPEAPSRPPPLGGDASAAVGFPRSAPGWQRTRPRGGGARAEGRCGRPPTCPRRTAAADPPFFTQQKRTSAGWAGGGGAVVTAGRRKLQTPSREAPPPRGSQILPPGSSRDCKGHAGVRAGWPRAPALRWASVRCHSLVSSGLGVRGPAGALRWGVSPQVGGPEAPEVTEPSRLVGQSSGGEIRKQQLDTRVRQEPPGGPPVHLAQVSFVIPAFNSNFTLDLELNHHLLSSQYVERHFSREGTAQRSTGAGDHCYYQGKLRGNPHSFAALSTCQGLHGVFSDGNLTYIVEPQEMAGPWGASQVSLHSSSLSLLMVTASASPSSLSNLSHPALLRDPSSNVPSVPQVTSHWAPVSFAPVSRGAPRA